LKSLYLHKKRPFLRDPLSPETKQKFKRGHEVGNLAHDLFPNGINLAPSNPNAYKKNAEKAAEHIEQNTPVLYEVPFYHGDLLAIMDVVTYDQSNWNVYEIKSSLSLSDTYLWDITFQSYVINLFGVKHARHFLVHLNPHYVREEQLQPDQLFSIVSVDDEIEKRIGLLPPLITKMRETEKLEKSPDITIGKHCFMPYKCDFFGHCWKHIHKPSVFNIPDLPFEKKIQFLNEGKSDLTSSLPYIQEIKQKNRATSLLRNEIIIQNEKLSKFQTMKPDEIIFLKLFHGKPAIPPFPLSKPFQVTPLMLIHSAQNDNQTNGFECIASQPGSLFWESVLDLWKQTVKLAENHTMICYGDAEYFEILMTDLEAMFQQPLQHIRMIDLQQIFKNAYYCAPDIDENASFASVMKHFTGQNSVMDSIAISLNNEYFQNSAKLSEMQDDLRNKGISYLENLALVFEKIQSIAFQKS